MLRDRLTAEVTYYNKVTKDGIFSALSSPSSGFPGNKFINIGEFTNRGFELALQASLLNRDELRVNMRGTLATNKNRINVLGQETAIPNSAIGQLVGAYNVAGFPMGSFFFKRILSATLTTPGTVTDVMCEGGTNFGRGDGSAVPCAGAPLIYFGSPTPTWLSALSADVSWRRFTLAGVAEFQGGHFVADGNVGGQHVFFNNSRAAVEQTDPILVAHQVNGLFGAAGFIKSGFGKVRNVSLTYEVPGSWASVVGASRASVTFTGANLATIWRAQDRKFGVRAQDPEVRFNNPNFYGDPNLTNGYTQESWPQFRRFLTTIRLSF